MDYLHLISSLEGKTIKIRASIATVNKSIRLPHSEHKLILDTGADTTALTREVLTTRGYGKYNRTGKKKSTATGKVELLTCEINSLTIANQFEFGKCMLMY